MHLKPPEKEGEISSSFHHLNSHHLNTISKIINLYLLSEAALDTGGGVLTKTPQTEKGIDYGNDDDDPETGATKPPGNTNTPVENSENEEAGNGATEPPKTTEQAMGLPRNEQSILIETVNCGAHRATLCPECPKKGQTTGKGDWHE